MNVPTRLGRAILVWPSWAGLGLAQTSTGVISGRVIDASGLGIAGAQVTLTQEATSDRRQLRCLETGDFVFAAVSPGSYTLTVEQSGMKRLEKRNLNITASERLSVGTLTLEVGALTESVTVTAQGTPVQTMSQERSAVLTTSQMQTLMSRSRDYISLLRVLPGVVAAAETDVLGKNPAMTMQGIRNKYQTYSVDGLFMNNSGDQHQVYFPTNMEAVAEVKVLMTNYQAEYGRSGGAVVNAVTKSGTQEFHGGAYVYKRHEQFNANGYFNNLNRLPKPRYRYATAGFTIGGPVYWPGKFNSNREKLFFFFSSETLRGVSPQAIRQLTVPTELERAGNFSGTLELNDRPVVVRDPTSGSPFPGAVIPPVRINSNGQKLLGVFRLPNQLDRSVTKGNYNYVFQESYFSPKQSNLFRIDLNATSKLRLFFRGSLWREGNQGYNVGGAATTWDLIKSDARYDDNAGVFSGSYVFSPTLVQEFSVGAHHSNEATDPVNWADMRQLDRAALGITLPQFYPQFNPYNMIPWASFGGVPNAASISIDSRYPKQGADTAFTFSYGLSKVWSAHTAKTGFYAERMRGFLGHRGTFPGQFSFARDVNNPNDANWAYANAVLGNFYSYSESDARNGTQLRRGQVEWYVQDTWKVFVYRPGPP